MTPIFVVPGDPLLTHAAVPVAEEDISSPHIQSIIDEMFSIAKGERQGDGRVRVGLAAPQIGVCKQIILVDVGADNKKNLGELKAYINPEIVWRSEEIISDLEGCYSVDDRVVGAVERSERIRLKAFDRHGNIVHEECAGFTARIFQHEVDHLNGIRFPDRVGECGTMYWIENGEFAEFRQKKDSWPHRCSWQMWLAMKAGSSYEAPVTTEEAPIERPSQGPSRGE